MNISYDHYRVFYYVAKYKSFTRAAEILYNNQPNLTRAIKTLEKEIGCTLFERTNKGVRLTEDGVKLYEHISLAFEHIQAGEEAISLKRSLESGIVSIGASEIALRCYLLPILDRYHSLYDGVRIKTHKPQQQIHASQQQGAIKDRHSFSQKITPLSTSYADKRANRIYLLAIS